MKSSPVSSLLWIVNLALLVGGGYLAFDFYKSQRDSSEALSLQATEAIGRNPKKTRIPAIETWEELKPGNANFTFYGGSLQMGKPHKKKTETVVGPDPGPDVKPPPVLPDLAQIRKNLEEELSKKITIFKVLYVPKLLASSTGSLKTTATLQLDAPLKGTVINLRLGENLLDKSWSDDAMYNNYVRAVMDAQAIEIYPSYVLFAVTSKELNDALAKYKDEDLAKLNKKDRPIDGRYHISLPVPLEDPFEGLVELSASTKPVHRTTPGGTGTSAEFADVVEKLPPAEIVPESPYNMAEEFRDTRVNGDDVQLGWGDMNQDTFSSMVKYASTQFDPRTKRPIGLKISDDLPESSFGHRVGARGGDILKSVNGTPVTEINAAKNLIIRLRDEGVTKFTVIFERNGADRTKNFTLPPKNDE